MKGVIVHAALAAFGICVPWVPSVARADATPVDQEALRARADVSSAMVALEGATARVRASMRRARGRGHDAEVACLDPVLSRVDVAARYGREYAQNALVAWRVGDVAVARHEMMRLTWRREASRQALRDADACAAPEDRLAVREGTTVRVWIDPSLPKDVTGYP